MPMSPGDRAAALDVLGLPADATPEQITRAYRHLARITHPDHTGATDAAAGDRFGAISDAYHRLVTAPSPPPVLVHRPIHRRVSRPAPARPSWVVDASWAPPLIVAGPVIVTPVREPSRGAHDER